jgi:hypothetical protein
MTETFKSALPAGKRSTRGVQSRKQSRSTAISSLPSHPPDCRVR